MTDAIDKVQAMVGCDPIMNIPAPDCSTFEGAIDVYLDRVSWYPDRNAELGNAIVAAFSEDGCERAMATAVCELILKAIDDT